MRRMLLLLGLLLVVPGLELTGGASAAARRSRS